MQPETLHAALFWTAPRHLVAVRERLVVDVNAARAAVLIARLQLARHKRLLPAHVLAHIPAVVLVLVVVKRGGGLIRLAARGAPAAGQRRMRRLVPCSSGRQAL